MKYVPVWSVAAVCLFLAAVLFGWFDYRLTDASEQTAQVISATSMVIGAPRAAAGPAPDAPGPGLAADHPINARASR